MDASEPVDVRKVNIGIGQRTKKQVKPSKASKTTRKLSHTQARRHETRTQNGTHAHRGNNGGPVQPLRGGTRTRRVTQDGRPRQRAEPQGKEDRRSIHSCTRCLFHKVDHRCHFSDCLLSPGAGQQVPPQKQLTGEIPAGFFGKESNLPI